MLSSPHLFVGMSGCVSVIFRYAAGAAPVSLSVVFKWTAHSVDEPESYGGRRTGREPDTQAKPAERYLCPTATQGAQDGAHSEELGGLRDIPCLDKAGMAYSVRSARSERELPSVRCSGALARRTTRRPP